MKRTGAAKFQNGQRQKRHKSTRLALFILILLVTLVPFGTATAKDSPQSMKALRQKADQLFNDNFFDQALPCYDALLKDKQAMSMINRSELLNRKALCLYYTANYSQAEKTVLEGLSSGIIDFDMRFLLGKIYFDQDHFTKAAQVLEKALASATLWEQTDPVREYLAYVYEEMAVQSQIQGNEKDWRKFLEKALTTLKQSDEAENGPMGYSSPMRHRIFFLEHKLKTGPVEGTPVHQIPADFSKEQLFQSTAPFLDKEQQKKLKYPFEIDDAMRDWVKIRLSGIDSDILKARKLFRLMHSESGLRVADSYDQFLYPDKKGFWLGRTAKEVFHELFPGKPELGQHPGLKYRYGDCESATNLYIALAREAGLRVFMTRLFKDLGNGYLGQHRGAGVITDDGRLVIVDLNWYQSIDAPYKAIRVLNDLENFSYYLVGFNNSGKDAEPFLNAALKIDSANEIALIDLASKAIRTQDLTLAKKYLGQIPETAKSFDQYWLLLSRIEEKQKNPEGALDILKQSQKYVVYSPQILRKTGLLYYAKGDIDAAYKALMQSVEISPFDQGPAWRTIAEIETKRGNYQAAIQAYEQSKNLTIESEAKAKAEKSIAEIYVSLKNYSMALSFYNNAWVSFHNADVPAYALNILSNKINKIKIANKIIELSQIQEGQSGTAAINWFKQCLQMPSSAPIIHVGLGNLYLQTGKWGPADTEFKKAFSAKGFGTNELSAILESYQKAQRLDHGCNLISPLIHQHPDRERLFIKLGDFHFDHKDYDKAEEQYLKAGSCKSMAKILDVYLKEQNFSKATHVRDTALQMAPLDAKMINGAARLAFLSDDTQSNIDIIEAHIQKEEKPSRLWFQLGYVFYQHNRNAQAIDYYQKALQTITPECDSGNDYNNIALCYENMGDTKTAQNYYHKALEKNPNHALALYNLANLYSKTKQWDKANAAYAKALVSSDMKEHTLVGLLNCYKNQGNTAKGIELAAQQLKKQKNAVKLWYRLVYFCYKNYQYKSAIECGKNTEYPSKDSEIFSNIQNIIGLSYTRIDNLDKAVEHLRQATAITSEHAFAHANLADAYRQQKRWRLAEKSIGTALSLHPLRPHVVNVALSLYEDMQQREPGLERLISAIEKQSAPTGLWVLLADNSYNKKEYRRALGFYEKELDHTQDSKEKVKYLQKTAQCLEKLGKLEKAAEAYEALIEINPNDPEYYVSLSHIRQKLNHWDQVEEDLEKGLRVIPADNALILAVLKCHTAQGEMTRGIERVEQLIASKQEPEAVLQRVGNWAYNNGHYETALSYYTRQTGPDPIHTPSMHLQLSLGRCYHKLNKPEKAREWFIQARKTYKDSWLPVHGLGRFYMGQGDWEHVKQVYQNALGDLALNYFELDQALTAYAEHGKLAQGCDFFNPYVDQESNPGLMFSTMADRCFTAKDFNRSLNYSKKQLASVEQEAQKAPVLWMMAFCADRLGDHKSSERYFDQAVSLDKGNALYLKSLVQLLCEHHKPDKARALIDSFAKDNKSSADYFDLIADYYKFMGDWSQARLMYRAALRLNASVDRYLALISVTMCPDEKWRLTIEMGEKYPTNIRYLIEQSRRETNQGRYDQALTLLKRIEPFEKDSVAIYFELYLLYQLGRLEEFHKTYQNGESILKKEGIYAYITGLVHFLENDYKQAIEYFKTIDQHNSWYQCVCMSHISCLITLNQLTDAKEIVKTMLKSYRHQEPQFLLLLAEIQLLENHFDEAEECIREFNKYGYGDVGSTMLELYLLINTGQIEKARLLWAKVAEQVPITMAHLNKWLGFSPQLSENIVNFKKSL